MAGILGDLSTPQVELARKCDEVVLERVLDIDQKNLSFSLVLKREPRSLLDVFLRNQTDELYKGHQVIEGTLKKLTQQQQLFESHNSANRLESIS